ncbi:unnamed protein product, partial [marine sediment metagenome]
MNNSKMDKSKDLKTKLTRTVILVTICILISKITGLIREQ